MGVYRRVLADSPAGRRYSVRTAPTGEFIPYAVFEANERHGVYMGLEWSFCRIEAVTLDGGTSPAVRVRAGNVADLRAELAAGETLQVRPGFLGAYCGALDDADPNKQKSFIDSITSGNLLNEAQQGAPDGGAGVERGASGQAGVEEQAVGTHRSFFGFAVH